MSTLVLVTARDTRPKRLEEFRLGARTLATLWGESTRIVAVDDGDEICKAIEEHKGLSRLAICCHGWPDRILARDRGVRVGVQAPPGVVSVEYLARTILSVADKRLHIALACCSAAADPGLERWLPGGGSFGPGGSESLAAYLYRWLARERTTTVVAHAASGHTTRCPALRRWSLGGLGESLLDVRLGAGAHKVRAKRTEWIQYCETVVGSATRAERILAGVVHAPYEGMLGKQGVDYWLSTDHKKD